MQPKTQNQTKPNFQIDYNNFSNSSWIQDFINKQLWVAGASFNSDASGNVVSTEVQWGGQSRFLCGFNFYAATPTAHRLSIKLNQETMVDSVPLVFFTPTVNQRFIQYFELIRPLSGNDTLTFSTVSTVAEAVYYGVYMTRAYNKYYSRD